MPTISPASISTSALGLTKVVNSITSLNQSHGIEVDAVNKVQISSSKAFNNGNTTSHGDGLHVSTGNFNLVIQNSSFIGNFGNGIEAQLGTGVLTLSSTSYIGNDAEGTGLYDNLYLP